MNPVDGSSRATIVFYAHDPGAFVDLAADARRVFGLDGDVVIDGHLPECSAARVPGLAPTGIEDASVINRTIRVLIARGHPPNGPAPNLDALAAADGLAPPAAALRVLEPPNDQTSEKLGRLLGFDSLRSGYNESS